MKRDILYVFLIAVLGITAFASCKKNYHCQCTYNNKITLIKDLGNQTKDDAKEICDGYDTTVKGEDWTCTLN